MSDFPRLRREATVGNWGARRMLTNGTTVSLGKSSSTAVERVYKETVVLVDVISEDGGPGAFINVSQLLQSSRDSWQ